MGDGSYGSDDRTSEIRKLGFAHRRHLGPMQMTTDTAVLVSSLVLEDARPLAEIPFLDSPEITDKAAADASSQSAPATNKDAGKPAGWPAREMAGWPEESNADAG